MLANITMLVNSTVIMNGTVIRWRKICFVIGGLLVVICIINLKLDGVCPFLPEKQDQSK